MTHRTKTSPYQLAVIANDFQIPFQGEEALLVFKMFLRRERPDWLILNGDSQDFWELSSYDSTARTGKEFRRGDRTPQRKSSTVTFWRRIRLSFVRQGWSMRSQSRKDDGTSKETMPRSDGNQASLRGIRTRVFKRRAASKLFGGEGRLTKHKIATALADRLAGRLAQPREEHRDRNPERGFAGEGRPQGRQAPTLFVARHLRPVPATDEKGHITLGETGALAVGPQVVFEFGGCH